MDLKGDLSGDKVRAMFAEHGFTPSRQKVEFGEVPKATFEIGEATYELWDALDRFEGASEFAATRTDSKGRPARLLTVASAAENDALVKWLAKQRVYGSVWLGCSDETEEGNWRWMTDSSDLFYSGGKRADGHYSNWGPGEPNNAGNNEDCAILLKTGVWNDENCDNKHRTVLKYGPDVPAEGGHDEL